MTKITLKYYLNKILLNILNQIYLRNNQHPTKISYKTMTKMFELSLRDNLPQCNINQILIVNKLNKLKKPH